MSWYAQMFKSQEVARERNRREQRRLELDLTDGHGIEFVARYRIEEVNQRQRLVEKDLERIRQGIHRKPAGHSETSQNNRGNQGNQGNQGYHDNIGNQDQTSTLVSSFSPRSGNLNPMSSSLSHAIGSNYGDTPRDKHKPTALIDAIVYLKNNPLAIESVSSDKIPSDPLTHSDITAIQPKLKHPPSTEVRSPRKPQDTHGKFVPAYLTKTPEKPSKYAPLLQTPSPILVKKHPGPSVSEGQGRGQGQAVDVSGGQDNTDSGQVKIATPDCVIQSGWGATMSKHSSKDGGNTASSSMESSDVKVKDRRPGGTKAAMILETNPDNYNADGSLRTELQVESFDKRWEEAQKARYIRCNDEEVLKREKELDIDDIFSKK